MSFVRSMSVSALVVMIDLSSVLHVVQSSVTSSDDVTGTQLEMKSDVTTQKARDDRAMRRYVCTSGLRDATPPLPPDCADVSLLTHL